MSRSRSRDARRLAAALSAETRVRVGVEWDGSSRWLVTWQGGPTLAAMRQLVEQLVPGVAPSFGGLALAWYRGLPAAAWARALIRSHHAGDPAGMWELLAADVTDRTFPVIAAHMLALGDRLDETPYPEMATTADEAPLVERLVRLAGPAGSEYRMAQLLATHDLGSLGVAEAPAGVVSIDERRRRTNRAPGA